MYQVKRMSDGSVVATRRHLVIATNDAAKLAAMQRGETFSILRPDGSLASQVKLPADMAWTKR